MGKILAVWSDSRKSGKSIITYMLANRMVHNRNLKVLVCCLNFKHSSLSRLFGIEASATGLEDLINYKFYEDIEEDILKSLIPRCGDIYFLGSNKMTNGYALRNMEKYAELFAELKNFFDLIIVDTSSENENVLTKMVLHQAEMILKLYCQDIENLIAVRTVKEEDIPYNQENVYLISKYRNIYPKKSDLKHTFRNCKLFIFDYCETLQEMKNRDSLYLYLQRETACNKSIGKLSDYLLKSLGLSEETDIVIRSVGRSRGLEQFFRRVGNTVIGKHI